MGGICVRPRREDRDRGEQESFFANDEAVGFVGVEKKAHKWCNSGELRMAPGNAAAGKVSETGSILGRAGIAGIERAVEVFDALGSSISNLNPNSGFASGVTTRGNKISILAFEVANTIAKGANLWRSLSNEHIQFLKEEVFLSEGVRKLVSTNNEELLRIASADKKEELDVFSREVIRFGDLCKDPTYHNLGRYFEKLISEDLVPQEQLKDDSETMMQQLITLVQNTSELYHELHALDRFEQDNQRRLQEEELLPPARRESHLILHSELKRQRKLVKGLKKKSLWSRNLEEIVEKLVDIVALIHKKILLAFGSAGNLLVDTGPAHNQRLGASGLALHYANVINQIDNIVSRPLALPPTTRDNLYRGLPIGVKEALRSRLLSFDVKEEYTVAQIKTEMQKTLRWIVPMADNTVRAHQGFGWVGEWANIGTQVSKQLAPEYSIVRIQTLHHADKQKTEECILELVVWLHHLVIQVKNKGYGYASVKAVRPRLQETKQEPSQVGHGKTDKVPQISKEERALLEHAGSKKALGRSRSLDFVSTRRGRSQRNTGLSWSLGNSPARDCDVALHFHVERTRVLDVMDGLDILNSYPLLPFQT